MLKIEAPDFKFCPTCGTALNVKQEEGENRKYCPNCDWVYYPHVSTAACAVAVRKGQVLLVKRAREPYKGTWMFPAGYVSFGEHPAETVVREIREETGYQTKVIRLLDVLQVADDPRALGHFAFFYEVLVSGKIKPADLEENSAINWFDLTKLPKIGWKSHQQIIGRLQNKL